MKNKASRVDRLEARFHHMEEALKWCIQEIAQMKRERDDIEVTPED